MRSIVPSEASNVQVYMHMGTLTEDGLELTTTTYSRLRASSCAHAY